MATQDSPGNKREDKERVIKTPKRWRELTSVTAVLATAGLIISNPSAIGLAVGDATPGVTGLNGPRGVTVGPADRSVYTEMDGSFRTGPVFGPGALSRIE